MLAGKHKVLTPNTLKNIKLRNIQLPGKILGISIFILFLAMWKFNINDHTLSKFRSLEAFKNDNSHIPKILSFAFPQSVMENRLKLLPIDISQKTYSNYYINLKFPFSYNNNIIVNDYDAPVLIFIEPALKSNCYFMIKSFGNDKPLRYGYYWVKKLAKCEYKK